MLTNITKGIGTHIDLKDCENNYIGYSHESTIGTMVPPINNFLPRPTPNLNKLIVVKVHTSNTDNAHEGGQ